MLSGTRGTRHCQVVSCGTVLVFADGHRAVRRGVGVVVNLVRRTAAVRDEEGVGVPERVLGGAESGLVRYLSCGFKNEGTVGRVAEAERARIGHAATVAGRLVGDKRSAMSKKDLASSRCLSIGRR